VTKVFTQILGIILLLAGVLAVAPETAGAGETASFPPKPVKAFKGKECVEPVDVMRREHMTFLYHQRDETVQGGIRGKKYSLRQCIECHAVPDQKAGGERTVRAFCGECHKFAAVTIDCFQCHTTKPEKVKVKSSVVMPTPPLLPGHPTMNKKTDRPGGWKKKTLFAALDPVPQQESICNADER
jgi:hypothetical protein|tara:strand:- start:126 stop:677 length:552 start_codon:yes stop_codon:yes gene_type:complete